MLLINPTDSAHKLLNDTIEAAYRRLRSEESLEAETEADIRTIVTLGQSVLKHE